MAKSSSPLDTPMMRQYLETKAEHPDALLFMRMGDFFELFLDDAKEAARILGITLTCRNKGAEEEIPMAGVPWRSLETHLPKVLAAGWKVAVMDQLQDPKEAKGLVERGLTRIITAGTLIDEDVLPDGDANFLVALTGITDSNPIGIAALDISTGRFQVEEASNAQELGMVLARLQPKEIIVPESLHNDEEACARLQGLIIGEAPPQAGLAAFVWKADDARRRLCEKLQVGSLDGFGIGPQDDHLAAAAAAAVHYAETHTLQPLPHLRRISRIQDGDYLLLDASCRRNLELLRNSHDGSRQGSLLATIDKTRTALGARTLADWLSRPLANIPAIHRRHQAVAFLVAGDELRDDLRDQLLTVYDLERLLARIATGRCHGRDLVQLATTLQASVSIMQLLAQLEIPSLLVDLLASLDPEPDLLDAIERTLVDDPPMTITEGGMIRDGVDKELDELRGIKRDAGEWLAGYQAKEAQRCGIPKIKVGYNKVFGYYLEVSKIHSDKVPEDFIRKQTLVNAERFITPELKEYEDKALGAEERIRQIESRIFAALRDQAGDCLPSIQACADALATIDVVAGLAETARLGNWCQPIVDESRSLDLRQARHPVVEQVLGKGRFVANDTKLDADDTSSKAPGHLAIITGPNMAGKSTYIRQVALAVVLAQAGSFVPAGHARLGVVDRLFTRVGAGDELARNMSTFMVEMAETAAILNNATDRSLVVLDEVGRGTSTFDGLSLAWAITEFLHDRSRCRCLFATHYHELTDLADDRHGIHNLSVAVAEQDDDVVFLHRIDRERATKSYGIHVARLAGVPQAVLKRAREVLATLEQLNLSLGERERADARDPSQGAVQLTLFEPVHSPTLQRLKDAAIDDLSPRQAQELLYELQRMARKE